MRTNTAKGNAVITALAALASLAAASASRAGDLPLHVDLQLLAAPMERAHAENVHVVFLGDSRSTASHRFGALVPALQHRLWSHYGTLGMTPVAPGGALVPSGNPRGFGVMGIAARFPEAIGVPAVDVAIYPPEVKSDRIRLVAPMTHGWMLWTDWDASLLDPALGIEPAPYFETGDDVVAELFLRLDPDAVAEIETSVNVHDGDAPDPNAGQVHPWTTHVVARSTLRDEFTVHRQHVTEHAEVPGRHVNIGLRLRPAKGRSVEVLGGRWVSTVETGGVAVSAFAQLGYRTFHHLDRHAEESRALAALAPDALVIFLDANDIFAADGEVFRTNLLEIIRRYRDAAGARAPILLMNGFPVTGLHPAFQDRYQNEFPAVMHAIAEDDPDIAWINGWGLYSDRELVAPEFIGSFHLDVGVDLWTFTDRLGELMLSTVSRAGGG